ncbi:MAG: hypothetical protein PVH37_15295 [Desulfobacterales bacterium]
MAVLDVDKDGPYTKLRRLSTPASAVTGGLIEKRLTRRVRFVLKREGCN